MSGWKSSAARRGLLAIWALFTVMLLGCIFLLVRELEIQGKSPLAIPGTPITSLRQARAVSAAGSAVETLLYFANADGSYLVAERRRLDLTESVTENCKQALAALIEGPRDVLTRVLPPETRVRAVYLLEPSELVVDFSREIDLGAKSSLASEALLVYGVAHTVTRRELRGDSADPPRRVRILVEGTPPDRFPAHFDLSEPIAPDESWIAPPPAGGARGG